ncbi:MAG: aspartate--tRNA ligase [Planctomycetota bacterium]
MADWRRTHDCGALRSEHLGQEVVLCGWVENRRHHGALIFIDLRDRYGLTQVTVQEDLGADLFEACKRLGAEDVVSIAGSVRLREQPNPDRATGEVEVVAESLEILSESEPPPFEILDDVEANEELRLRYRYLDLRRRPMQEAMIKRSQFVTAIRVSLAEQGFLDIETPILTKSTPEGARDYLVPSRVHPGQFYALPQSPQIFKQLCMVSGLDRYYQIARCFRDEDLRADRQPEFTQIDLEMSFCEEDDVLNVVEVALTVAFEAAFGAKLETPFERMSYVESMRRFGNDKPDLRFGIEIQDLSEMASTSEFGVFKGAVDKGGVVRALCVPSGSENFSRKDIEKGLGAKAQELGAKGLAWCKVDGDGSLAGPVARFYEGEAGEGLKSQLGAKPGDLVLFAADSERTVCKVLSEIRLMIGDKLGLRTKGEFRFAWIMNFPMFDQDEETGAWTSSHHPFTAPVDWDLTDYSQDTANIQSRAYDLVMNGWELGSGSIRIHQQDVQKRVFEFLGIGEEEQQAKFGFLLDAFKYGPPPHGGIALGVDRLVTLALGAESIRDVIAFPKTARASDLMCEAPSPVAQQQLHELSIDSLAKETGSSEAGDSNASDPGSGSE